MKIPDARSTQGETAMAAKKNVLEKTLELAGEFVTKREGNWGHSEWEAFLKKAAKAGIDVDDEGKRNLGNILEAAKFLYHRADIQPSPKEIKKKEGTKSKEKAEKDRDKSQVRAKAAAVKKPARKKSAEARPGPTD